MKLRESVRTRKTTWTVSMGLLFALSPVWARGPEQALPKGDKPSDEFFIISSVDLSKRLLVLKRPTEVTELMEVDAKTEIVNEAGKLVTLKNLRAGDTVFVVSRPAPDGERVATRIRQGSMTLEEVHRRYLAYSLK